MLNNSIISLAAGKSQIPLILTAKKAGYNVIAIDRNQEAPGLKYVDEHIDESTYSTEKVISKLMKLQNKYNFKGVIARTSGPALYTAAAIAEKFHLPGLTKEIIPLATEKSKLSEFCKKNGFVMPEGQRVNDVADVNTNFNYPLIVKPDLPLYGKKDVKLLNNKLRFDKAIKSAKKSSGNKYAKIEKYIDGIDVSVLFLSKYGKSEIITYWDELIGIDRENYIKGLGVSVPSVTIVTEVKNKIDEIVKIFSSYFKNINALLILSFRVDLGKNIYIIELHADLGGDLIADILLPKANENFNFFKLAIDVCLDKDIRCNNLKFKPTILIYNSPQYSYKIQKLYLKMDNHIILQHENIKKNLKKASVFFKEKVIILPYHSEWIIKNENGGL